MIDLQERFAHLYRGKRGHMGKFTPDGKQDGRGKVTGKNEVMPKAPSPEDWTNHLWKGKYSIGIIPINEDSECSFAAIDIDEYVTLDKKRLLEDIQSQGLPIVACESKSGGIHLYVFFKIPVPAASARKLCNRYAARLGVATFIIDKQIKQTEVFPKQDNLKPGNTGNYINLPYALENRRAIVLDVDSIRHLELEEFLDLAESNMIVGDLDIDTAPLIKSDDNPETKLYEAPPCLILLIKAGGGKIRQGERNTAMFNICLYIRKRFLDSDDGWQSYVPAYNKAFFEPMLEDKEVDAIIASIESKEGYFYTCASQPIASYCDKATCRLRKFGIGVTEDVEIGDITIIKGSPKIILLTINGYEVDFEGDEIIADSANAFKRKVFERTDMMLPRRMKMDDVHKIIEEKMKTARYVTVPLEATEKGQLFMHLQDFIRHESVEYESVEDMWASVYNGKVVQRDTSYLFKFEVFMSYLNMNRFHTFNKSELFKILKDQFYGSPEAYHNKISGLSMRYWKVDRELVDEIGRADES